MPMYNYTCPNGHKFEALETIANRAKSECFSCGRMADMVISAPRIDPNADLPGQRMKQRRGYLDRARGKDMWAGNQTNQVESLDRDAHAKRAERGENPIYSK